MKSTGLVLAAGAIAAVNETVFAPTEKTPAVGAVGDVVGKGNGIVDTFNWRLVPATLILAATLGGLEKVAPGFAVGLGGLVVLSVLVIPVGKAPTPLENIASTLGYK